MKTERLIRYLSGQGVLADRQEAARKAHKDGEQVAIYDESGACAMGFANGNAIGLSADQARNLKAYLKADGVEFRTERFKR